MEVFDDLWFPHAPVRPVTLKGDGNKTWSLKHYQTIAWIAIKPPRWNLKNGKRGQLPSDAPVLPAILDTGCNSTLSLREDHLEEHLKKSGLKLSELIFEQDSPRPARDSSGRTHLVPTLAADIWLLAENPRSLDESSCCLPVGETFGISVFPTKASVIGIHFSQSKWEKFREETKTKEVLPKHVPGPSCPILGLAAFSSVGMKIAFNCTGNGIRVSMKLPRCN